MRTKAIPNSAFADLVETYQHRALSLEIELRQLARDGSLSQSAYKKRVAGLRKLKNDLAQAHAQARQQPSAPPPTRFLDDLPAREICSPAEEALCQRYLSEVERFIKCLYQDSNEVIRWAQRSLQGRLLRFLTTFDLSRLRAKILKRENQMADLQQDQQQWYAFSTRVLKALGRGTVYDRSQQPLPALKQLFYSFEDLSSQIFALRLRCERDEEEINWMEHWLTFQEMRFAQRTLLPYSSPFGQVAAQGPAARPRRANTKAARSQRRRNSGRMRSRL